MKTERQMGVKKAFLIPARQEVSREEGTEAGGSKKAHLVPGRSKIHRPGTKRLILFPDR